MKSIQDTKKKELERAEGLLQQAKLNVEIEVFDGPTVAALKEAMELFDKWEDKEKVAEVYQYWGDYLIVHKDDFESAKEFCQKSLKIRLKLFGEEHPLIVKAYGQLGFIESYYNIELAKEYWEKALSIALKLEGEHASLIAECYHNMASSFSQQENYSEALNYMQKSIKILECSPNSDQYLLGLIYNDISVFYHRSGECIQLKNYLDKAALIYHQILPPYHKEMGRLFLGYYCLYHYIGDVKQATLFIHKAIEVLEHDSPINLALAYSYHLLMESNSGNFDDNISYGQKSIDILSALNLEKDPLVISLYNDMGLNLMSKGKMALALDCFNKSLDIALELGPRDSTGVATCYQRLGRYYLKDNVFDMSEEYLQKSLDIIESKSYPIYSGMIQILSDMADLHLKKGNYYTALKKQQKVFCITLEDYDNEDIYDYPYLNLQTHSHKIRIAYKELIVLFFQKSNCFFLDYLHGNKEIKKLIASFQGLNVSLELANQLRLSFYSDYSKLEVAKVIQPLLTDSIEMVFTLFEHTDEYQYLQSMFNIVEQDKAYLMLLNKKEEDGVEAGIIPQYISQSEKDLKSQLILLEKSIQAQKQKGEGGDKILLQKWENDYFNKHNEFEALKKQLETDYPDYYRQKYSTETVTIEALKKALQENQTVLSYFIGEEKIYLFVITSEEYEVFSLEKPKNWGNLIQSYLQSIKLYQKAQFHQIGFELYQTLLQEAMHHLIDPFEDEPKQVFIIPHAELHYLSFETLLIAETNPSIPYQDLDYLLNHCQISYHYSATLLHLDLQKQTAAERASTEMTFTGFAPVYESSSEGQKQALKTLQHEYATAVNRSEAVRSDGTWMPLPYSKIEVENISHLFEKEGLKSQSFLYETASKSNLEQQIGKSRFVLIAAHGIVNDEFPELSGLILASSGEKEVVGNSPSFEKHGDIWNEERSSEQTAVEDCILNMKEVAMIPMNADLVVLSSCESGIGELHKGEGMMAVNRGFLASGAKNVVSTLFKVNDRASSELTQLLFTHILKGESYSTALQKAKLELLKMKGMSPKSWSGFVLFGKGI